MTSHADEDGMQNTCRAQRSQLGGFSRSGYGEVAFLSPTCPLQRALIEAR